MLRRQEPHFSRIVSGLNERSCLFAEEVCWATRSTSLESQNNVASFVILLARRRAAFLLQSEINIQNSYHYRPLRPT